MGVDELVSEVSQDDTLPACPADGEAAVLWALHAARTARGQDALTAAEVAELVTRAGRQSMPRQAAQGHLARLASQGYVHRKKRRSSADDYTIMAAGEDRISSGATVTLIDPARALQEVRDLENLLEQLKGTVTICDPYLDCRTLDFIGSIKGATYIRLLTERVTEEDKVKRDLKAVERQIGATVEVRKAPKGLLHDRYIIHDGGMLILGTSLNGFGLKQSFISKAGSDVREATKAYFSGRWDSASPL